MYYCTQLLPDLLHGEHSSKSRLKYSYSAIVLYSRESRDHGCLGQSSCSSVLAVFQ